MASDRDLRTSVRDALVGFGDRPLRAAGVDLLSALGYASRKTLNLDGSVDGFLAAVPGGEALKGKPAAKTDKWRRVDFLFQLTNDEIPTLASGQQDFSFGGGEYHRSVIDSFVFLAIELDGEVWVRGDLVKIAREINAIFPMPAVLLFRYGALLSLAVIDRRDHKRDAGRSVIEKRISIIKDIVCAAPHRAHVDTLCDIALSNVKIRGRGVPTNFRDLYDGWIEALSAQALNQRFYKDLANWYFWSVKEVTFPAAARETGEARVTQNQIAVIRLLTRLIFVWFIKEKGLVPDALFETADLKTLLARDPTAHPDDGTFYQAILQNLFFATLNTEMSDERKWRAKASGGGLDGQYLIHSAYRYRAAFADPDRALALFKSVPFLNGGLFECLDREIGDRDLQRNPALDSQTVKEGSHRILRIDGFSERADNALHVPNKLFFAIDEKVDLNAEYDTKGKTEKACGLIELFSRYKFTVEENTPVEQEVALDPELLGKVFENLLASYNTDTRTTARKKSGSFYTPREVVDYMVDEALIAYFEPVLATPASAPPRRPIAQGLDFGATPGELDLPRAPAPGAAPQTAGDADARLRALLSFKDDSNPFSSIDTDALIGAIDRLKALDPACGSGAFPMGLLQKLIHVLHKLDPDNARWKAQNRRPLEMRLEAAKDSPDPSRRETEIGEAESALEKLDHDFSDAHRPDYARKLYLIDKCLFGVDLQPIAVQIAKLRFFISLVVSQKFDPAADNGGITALPNLETKLVAANSLIPIERPAQIDLFRNRAIEDKEAELREMNARYFGARTMKTKRARREAIGKLRDDLSDLLQSERGLAESDARKMAAWDPFDQNSAAGYFDPEWMFGLPGKFDLLIGNPPYVRHEGIKDLKSELERHYGGKDAKGSPQGAYAGTADLFVYFIQRGIELLSPGGAFAYITSNKWYRAKYGERLRSWLNREARLRRIVDFGDAEVFDAIAYPTIVIAARRAVPVQVAADGEVLRVMNWPQDRDKSEVEGFAALIDNIGFDMPQRALKPEGWQLEPLARRGLLERIRAAGMPLRNFVEARVFRGVTTGFNDAYVINGATKDRLIAEHASAASIIKPYLRGSDVDRWRAEPSNLYFIKIPSSENITHAWSDSDHAERVFSESLPSIYSHLTEYRSQLIDRYDQGRYFWECRSCSYWDDFEQPKLLSTKISFRPTFCVDHSGAILGNTAYFIKAGKFENFLLLLLNSSLSEYYSRHTFSTKQGGFYEVQPHGLEAFPIPQLNPFQYKILNEVNCAALVRDDSQFELLLNGFVYELFFKDDLHARGLTLFDEAARTGLNNLAGLEGPAMTTAATAFAAAHLTPGARLHTMLADLQSLDVVRIIEGKA